MNDPIHALVCFEYPSLNGGEYSWLATLPALRDSGVRVTALAPLGGPLVDVLRARDVAVVGWGLATTVSGRDLLLARRQRVAEVIAQVRPDLVHGNSLSVSRMVGPVAERLGIPSVGHLRDIVNLRKRVVDDLNCLDRTICVSAAVRDHHVGQGLRADKAQVVYNGVDQGAFRPRPKTGHLHRRWAMDARRTLIATVGQIGMRKGLLDACEAFAICAARLPQIDWLVIGERHSQKDEAVEYERQLRKSVADHGLDRRVHFVGRMEEMQLVLPECSLLLHAARQEPLGRVLLEAAACGVPVIATDVGGTREIFPQLHDGGLLVPAAEPLLMGQAMLQVLEDPQSSQPMAAGGPRRISARFRADCAGCAVAGVYHGLVG